ncbi:hypothetical protein SPRG_03179 [Saprolegnia parasitica CBS 223.65]|uniref:PH domain-containing protein n=1 Tax=Saprolegnia parasitica (strain CBS 223.65) TaxID=695850 RepID=A0A067CN70_SAPPC|nr:hypothetical protein SPRG_03179 [Saprolegnia parasitica CBS 223.65]KDO31963.1 hypothetical protein SPRG_03179 [Saprolegnia parasitica CBS 223.65]|eukprot:XP_012197159.1 hypothetical protein SPRG_03179 [Saprolegnia parasitica CBS 223.65]
MARPRHGSSTAAKPDDDRARHTSLPLLGLPSFLKPMEDAKRACPPKVSPLAASDETPLDSCSGLKDQFLRLKQKFHKATPETTTSESHAKTADAAKGLRRLSLDNSVWIDPRALLDPYCNKEIDMKPSELMRELETLNGAAQKMFVHDPWSNGAERWVLDDACLRGYMTCWTIETGGELVVLIARTIKALNANINPDIALQWIGRQLWGLTITLPLARNRELTMQHITVASSIDVALAKMVKVASSPEPNNANLQSGVPPISPRKAPAEAPETPSIEVSNGPSHMRSLSNDTTTPTRAVGHSRSLSSDATSQHLRSLSGDLRAEVHDINRLLAPPRSPTSSSSSSSTTKTWHALTTPGPALLDDDPFARCAPEKTGWLKKRSSGLNSWQLRWFELKGNRLYYFKHEKDGLPKGAIVLDKVYCIRGAAGDPSPSLTISPSGANSICMFKFSDRLVHHVFSRRSCTLRVPDDDEIELNAWINAICRASFQCYLSVPTADANVDENELYKYSSFQYLRETDPLLWEINPLDQNAIKKKASVARTKAEYTYIMSKYAHVLRHILLPRPRPISIEQTLRDIIPELFLINNILYGGETESIDDIFHVLEGYVKRFASTHEACVTAVSAVLQACARTIAGGDSFLVIRTLLGSSAGDTLIRPADSHGAPIVIDISSATPSLFTITLSSVFVFHLLDDVEKMTEDDAIEPLLRVQTLHVQEMDLLLGKSTRHLKIRQLAADDERIGGDLTSSRSTTYDFGALLDGLA